MVSRDVLIQLKSVVIVAVIISVVSGCYNNSETKYHANSVNSGVGKPTFMFERETVKVEVAETKRDSEMPVAETLVTIAETTAAETIVTTVESSVSDTTMTTKMPTLLRVGNRYKQLFVVKEISVGDMGSQQVDFKVDRNEWIKSWLFCRSGKDFYYAFEKQLIDETFYVLAGNNVDVVKFPIRNSFEIDIGTLNLKQVQIEHLKKGGQININAKLKSLSYENTPVMNTGSAVISEYEIIEE